MYHLPPSTTETLSYTSKKLPAILKENSTYGRRAHGLAFESAATPLSDLLRRRYAKLLLGHHDFSGLSVAKGLASFSIALAGVAKKRQKICYMFNYR